jgi:hypothetical protein
MLCLVEGQGNYSQSAARSFLMILSWHPTDEENNKKVFAIIRALEFFVYLHGRVICF